MHLSLYFFSKISQSRSGAPVVKGNKTFCTADFGTSKKHGTTPNNLWSFKEFKRGKSPQGHRFAQSTYSQRTRARYQAVPDFDLQSPVA
jgi:hypothetical protein